MGHEALVAVRQLLRECDIIIQPPGWGRIDISARYAAVIGGFAPRLDLSLDVPLLDVFVEAIDELPANEGITLRLAEHGGGAWFLNESDEVEFFPGAL